MEDRSPGATRGGGDGADASSDGRRRTVVGLVAAAVVVLGVVLAVVLVLGNRPEPAVVAPEAEVVTLPLPTPTVEPVAKEAGTAFFDALPSTVLSYALTGAAEDPEPLAAGALESYRLDYTDGGDGSLTVRASQWRTSEAAAAAFQDVLTAQADALAAAGAEEAEVEVQGGAPGRYVFLPGSDGMGTAWWTNGTVLIQVAGPAEAVPDVHAAFPL